MTIEQVKENKEQLQISIREMIRVFIKDNPGCLPSVGVSVRTGTFGYSTKRIMTIEVEVDVTIL